jgi:hypothetical protein
MTDLEVRPSTEFVEMSFFLYSVVVVVVLISNSWRGAIRLESKILFRRVR